jgi:FkbM family methyltransferase
VSDTELFEFIRGKQKVTVSITGDHYGFEFWKNFANWRYEPDTQALLKAFCTPKTLFLDVGAAFGSMSLSAAAYGARVWCFEPNPKVYEGLIRNISLNPSIADRIDAKNIAVSDERGILNLSNESNDQILSPIVFTSWNSKSTVQIDSIQSILDNAILVVQGSDSHVVLKMDIEGAEWKILANRDVLQKLSFLRSHLILALHPGLYRPVTWQKFTKFKKIFWDIRNVYDSWALFNRLRPFATIYRVNLNPVRRPISFVLLTLAGNHEYLLSFGEKS